MKRALELLRPGGGGTIEIGPLKRAVEQTIAVALPRSRAFVIGYWLATPRSTADDEAKACFLLMIDGYRLPVSVPARTDHGELLQEIRNALAVWPHPKSTRMLPDELEFYEFQ